MSAVCFHCGGEIPAGTCIEESCAAGVARFCCRGCHGAYLLITGAGLDDFYRRRTWEESGVPQAAFHDAFQNPYLSKFVYSVNGACAIDIIIDGVRCASCVWLNEKIMERLAGVREARVNYATGRAHVVFDPSVITPAAIFSRIAQIGYAPRPYTHSAARESANKERKALLIRFGTAFFLTMQLMAYSFALYAGYLQGIEAQSKGYLQLFSLLVTTPVVFYCGWPFLAGAWRGVVNGSANMEILIATGALSSYCYSIYAMIAGGEVYFETAAMIVTFILAGRLLENAAKRRATGGIERLLGLCTGEARRFRGETLETVDAAELKEGDVILVSPGERFLVDGSVLEGSSDVDESAATGEPLPVLKRKGDTVTAGTANLTGAVRVRCEKEAAGSFIARVARLVEEAQSRRAPIQGFADRVGAQFVPAVVAFAFVDFWYGYLSGTGFVPSLMTALSVVVIACPCAIGLATPAAILAGTGAAAARGIFFKGGDVLQRLSGAHIAIFDKTGTVTCGSPEVVTVSCAEGIVPGELLSLAASVESGSPHPIAKAIVERAGKAGVTFDVGENLRGVAGGGVTGTVAGAEICVGSVEFLKEMDIAAPDTDRAITEGTPVFVARDRKYLGCLVLRDRARPEAHRVASYFNRCGINTLLLSGDLTAVARKIAAEVGIRTAFGDMSPAEKASHVERLRGIGAVVLMVGDGINDAPALSAADVGCAVAGGTDIAIETSDVVLVKPDLEHLAEAHMIARRTMRIVKQNLLWAFLYNAVGIPLAMTGRLTPVYAAAAMACSSLCVVCNSLRITRVTWTTRSSR